MAQCFEPKDNIIYDEIKRTKVAGDASKVKGDPKLENNVFGFYYTDVLSADTEIVIIYRMRQVLANKATGTGESIATGDRLYYIIANNNVSATPSGTAGTDHYFCGWAKLAATTSNTTVLMNFDGTRYDETLSA